MPTMVWVPVPAGGGYPVASPWAETVPSLAASQTPCPLAVTARPTAG